MLPPYLSQDALAALIGRALAEDLGGEAARPTADVTTAATVPEDLEASARIQAKEDGVVAGLVVAEHVFEAVDERIAVNWAQEDGAAARAGTAVGTLTGTARSLLVAERLALNFVQRMSGIATATRRMVERAEPHGAAILDTRKTAPTLRALDKWAVRLGGGTNHRLGLHDLLLIKDNHLEAAGGVRPALEAAYRYRASHEGGSALKIELETRTLDEVRAALAADEAGHGPDILLLDNMARAATNADDTAATAADVDTSMLREAVALAGERFQTEASGNVTLQTVEAIAQTGVDFISSGALTHSVQALDVSMEMTL